MKGIVDNYDVTKGINTVRNTRKFDTGKKEIDVSWLSLILEN